jgi:hypothetical protein
MLPPEYAENTALSQSMLKSWIKYGSGMDLVPRPKSKHFAKGNVLERACCAKANGQDWKSEFLIVDAQSGISDAVFELIADGVDPEKLLAYKASRTKKDGTPYANSESTHAFIDAIIAEPGKTPISSAEIEVIEKLVESAMLVRPFELFSKMVGVHNALLPLGDMLGHFLEQVPMYWESAGVAKKGLLDLFWQFGGINLILDFKATGSLGTYLSALKFDNYIQSIHYNEGATELNSLPSVFVNIVCPMEPPYHARAVSVAASKDAMLAYWQHCEDYRAWNAAGRRCEGFGKAIEVKPFIR